MLLFLVTLKNFDVCTVTMGVACPLLRRSIKALDIDYLCTVISVLIMDIQFVNESSGVVKICVKVSSPIRRNFEVLLSTEDITAQGKVHNTIKSN